MCIHLLISQWLKEPEHFTVERDDRNDPAKITLNLPDKVYLIFPQTLLAMERALPSGHLTSF